MHCQNQKNTNTYGCIYTTFSCFAQLKVVNIDILKKNLSYYLKWIKLHYQYELYLEVGYNIRSIFQVLNSRHLHQ